MPNSSAMSFNFLLPPLSSHKRKVLSLRGSRDLGITSHPPPDLMFEFVFVLIVFADVSAIAPLDKIFIFSYLDLNLCRKLLFDISYTNSTKRGDNMSNGYNSSFVLVVVLFILLIIVGASFLY